MTPPMDRAREIAEGLTKAQRKAVLYWEGGPEYQLEALNKVITDREIREIRELGLANRPCLPAGITSHLTELGFAVRNILKEQDDGE